METGDRAYNKNSAKRRRLQNDTSDHSASTSSNAEIAKCVDRLPDILQCQQDSDLTQAMRNVVELIQGLQWLQTRKTRKSLRSFNALYSDALIYVDTVIDRLLQVDELYVSGDAVEDISGRSLQASFADAYQYLMDMIAEYNKGDDGLVHLTMDQELTLLVLPIALSRHFSTEAVSPLLLPLPLQLKSLVNVSGTNQPLLEIASRSVSTALVHVAAVDHTSADEFAEWLVPEFCRHLTQLAELEIHSQPQSPPQPFENCMQILEHMPMHFMWQHRGAIIPELIAAGNETALTCMAQIHDVDLPLLCADQSPSIFAKILLLDDQTMAPAIQRFENLLKAESDTQQFQVEDDIPTLLRLRSGELLFNLILFMGSDDSVLQLRARSALLTVRDIIDVSGTEVRHNVSATAQAHADTMKSISAADRPQQDSRTMAACMAVDKQLADFLSKHVLGILAYTNEVLQNANPTTASGRRSNPMKYYRSEQSRCKALRAIGDLAVLLGSKAVPFIHNIVTTLSPLLASPLASAALNSWRLLAESFDSAVMTANQLNTLIAPLLTVFYGPTSDVRTDVAEVINHVIQTHETAVKNHFGDICPIPETPLLDFGYAIMHESETRSNFQQRLVQLTQLLKSKDTAIITCTARSMCLLLKKHEEQVSQWRTVLSPWASGKPDAFEDATSRGDTQAGASLLVDAMHVLQLACRVEGQLADMAAASCAACLGIIGYIDCQKSGLAASGQTDNTLVLNDVSDIDGRRNFIFTLIADHLVHMFALAPSPRSQSYAAFAIQELMRQAGCTKDMLVDGAEDTAIRRCWNLLPAHVVEIIQPLLDSKYTSPTLMYMPSTNDQQRNRTPCILQATSHVAWLRIWVVELISQLGNAQVAPIFKVCTSAIKEGSADMLLFILSQLVYQHCLLSLHSRMDLSSSTGKPVVDLISEEILAVMSCDAEKVKMPAGQWRLCKGVVLGLFDSLDSCLRRMRDGRVEGTPMPQANTNHVSLPPEEQALVTIIESVPHSLIASAADACHQFARAVQHTELALRKDMPDRSPMLFRNADDMALARIQKQYFRMGDVDSVAGTVACREDQDHRQATADETIENNAVTKMGTVHAFRSVDAKFTAAFDAIFGQLLDKVRYKSDSIRDLALPLPVQACIPNKAELGDEASAFDLVSSALQNIGRGLTESTASLGPLVSGVRMLEGNISPNLICAHMLGDISLLADRMCYTSSDSGGLMISEMTSLVEQWRARVTCLPPIYSVQAPVLALHSSLYKILLSGISSSTSSRMSEAGSYQVAAVMGILSQHNVLTRLQAAQLARLAGHKDVALDILGEIELNSSLTTNLLASLQTERAQIQWDNGNYMDAIAEITRIVHTLLEILRLRDNVKAVQPSSADRESAPSGSNIVTDQQPQDVTGVKLVLVKATLLLAKWQQETRSVSTQDLLDSLMRIHRVDKSEKLAFALGQLYDMAYITAWEDKPSDPGEPRDDWELEVAKLRSYAIQYYASAATCSTQYVLQALSRLMTIWLNKGATLVSSTNTRGTEVLSCLRSTNRLIRNLATDLPAYYLLIILPQLISCIGHPDTEVFDVLEHLVLSAMEKYPQQTLWHLIGIQNSTDLSRADRCDIILAKAKAKEMNETGEGSLASCEHGCGVASLISQFFKVANSLRRLCDLAPSSVTASGMSMARVAPDLARCKKMDVIIPLQSSLVPTLPDMFHDGAEYELALSSTQKSTVVAGGKNVQTKLQQAMLHQPFSSSLPTISAFADEVEVMSSLQQPKKIVIIGSDRHNYPFLCKSEDDMRKDACAMRFSAMINHLLQANQQTRQRDLHIRTYAVVPLSEQCGVIEWVGSTTGIRQILKNQYAERGINIWVKQQEVMAILARNCQPSPRSSSEKLPVGSMTPRGALTEDLLFRHHSLTELHADELLSSPLSPANSFTEELLPGSVTPMEPLSDDLMLGLHSPTELHLDELLSSSLSPMNPLTEEPLSEFQAPTEPHAEGKQSVVLSQQERFTQEILPMFRPVFHEWFMEMFPSPERWLLSRTAFTRTAAVMSIVGFILGLGDRHFENIKLDDRSGEVVHIDFGFLFDVGKQLLEHPEQVPFRLTQNMVDAMGATGYEGTFRKTCEMTLRLLREHCDVLMSALEPLVYEPSMDWPCFDEHSSQPSGSGSGPAHLPRRARHALAIVRKKLQGTLNGETQKSVEEQVDELIREATDPGRLVQMYIGWAPYL